MKNIIKTSYKNSFNLLQKFCADQKNIDTTENISKLLAQTFTNKHKVMIAGNGGSSCDAMHFAEEFTGKFRKDRMALPVLSFTDIGSITCIGNDYGFEEIFARNIEAHGNEGDIFIALSTSGNSKNIIKAVDRCKKLKIKTIGLLGMDGGLLKGKSDYEFIIPGKTSDRIQEIHMTILHVIIEGTERILFPENYT